MKIAGRPITVLYAEDDDDDRLLARDAMRDARLPTDLRTVVDGEDLLDYLHRRGAYSDPASAPRPDVILLDLRMPKKDGAEALRDIKSDPGLRRIPVIVLTTSRAEDDVSRSYDLGANSFISKPTSFEGLVETMRAMGRYWFEVVELPPEGEIDREHVV